MNQLFDPDHSASQAAQPSPEERQGGERVAVYTDGACLGNPGPGGWAWAMAPDGRVSDSGAEPATTNQRMELRAVLEALRSNDGAVDVFSDSKYVVDCFHDQWWVGWLKRGWKNARREPIANRDLWEPLIELVRQRGEGTIAFTWVKGHAGDPMNELVDELAVSAARDIFG